MYAGSMPGVAPTGDRAVTAYLSPAPAPPTLSDPAVGDPAVGDAAVGDPAANASGSGGQLTASSPANFVIRFSICQA